jgi:predicted metal-dependent phosphoesterase TrpH
MRRICLRRPLKSLTTQAGERWVTADFHIHSTYSGGSLSPSEILKMAQNQLLDVVAISDHNDIRGAQEGHLIAAADTKLPLTIISQEISVGNHFHFLIIGGNQHWGNINRNQFIEKFSEHHNSGGVIILAHPWTMPKSSWASGFLKDIVSGHLLDAVELFNSSILELPPEHSLVIKSFWEEWAVPYNLGIVGGSDFHYHRQGRYLASGRTYLKVILPGEQGVMEALRNRRLVAGLFSYRTFDLGWLGAGTGVIFGAEPWRGELQRLVLELKATIKDNRFLKPSLKLCLSRLMESGNYQMVRELLHLSQR